MKKIIMNINLLSGACGAEIEGINLKNISEENIKITLCSNNKIDQQEQNI